MILFLFCTQIILLFGFKHLAFCVPDEGYSSNVPDEGYSSNVPDEGYSSNVPDEGYSRKVSCALNLISTFLSAICTYIKLMLSNFRSFHILFEIH